MALLSGRIADVVVAIGKLKAYLDETRIDKSAAMKRRQTGKLLEREVIEARMLAQFRKDVVSAVNRIASEQSLALRYTVCKRTVEDAVQRKSHVMMDGRYVTLKKGA